MAIQTTQTTTTTTVSFTTTTASPNQVAPKNLHPSYDDTDIGAQLAKFANGRNRGSAFDNLQLPGWAKSLLKGMLGETGNAGNLPSSSDAAKSIRDFQKENDIGLLGSDQVKQMADTGYCTMPNGERKQVPPDVQAAAQKMMDNNGELFKKLESAIRGSHDGLLSAADYDAALKDGSIGKPGTSDLQTMNGLDRNAFFKHVMSGVISSNQPAEYNAAKRMHDFQKDNDIGLLNSDQIKLMAETGYCKMPNGDFKQVPPDVQAAAQKMMDNNGELFKKLESAVTGKFDGMLSKEDVLKAILEGKLGPQGAKDAGSGSINITINAGLPSTDGANGLPSSADAAKSIQDFQKQNDIGLLGIEQVKQMAETGYCTMPNGEHKQVPPDVQAAAQKMMDNNGELFKKLESAIRGSHDGLLSAADYDAALKDGSIGKPGTADLAQAGDLNLDDIFKDNDIVQDLMKFIAALLGHGNRHLGDSDSKNNITINLSLNDNTGVQSADGASGAQSADGASGAQSPDGASTGKSAFGAIESMSNFFKGEMGDELLSREKMQQMADTGKFTKENGVTVEVPKDVQDSAKRMMADGGALFDKLESANTGSKDGLLGKHDFKPALKESIKETTSTMIDFQKKEFDGDFLTRAHMKEMAEKGTLTKNDGSTIKIPDNVREAAKNYMDNDAKLFKEVESWQDNEHDDKLSVKDAEKRAYALDHPSVKQSLSLFATALAGKNVEDDF